MAADVETFSGILEVVYAHKNGYLVGRFADGTKVLGPLHGDTQMGATYTLFGKWETEEYRGRVEQQFRFREHEVALPMEANAIIKYLVMNAKWLGEPRARECVDRYGPDTLTILKEQPDKVASEISGITPRRALEIQTMLKSKEEWERVGIGLNEIFAGTGIGKVVIGRCIEKWGHSSLDTIRQNPFILVDDIKGVGFAFADKVRENVGIAANDPYRIQCGVRHVLHEAGWSEGHTYLPRTHFIVDACKILGASGEVGNDLIEAQLPSMQALRQVHIDITPGGGYNIALQSLRDDEEAICEKIALLTAWKCAPLEPNTDGLMTDQVDAIHMISANNMIIIDGGPGVGKTYLISRLLASVPLGLRVAMAAPTGKAAKRITEQTGRPASTIHRLLGTIWMDGEFTFEYNESNPLPVDILIVDEMSMTDVPLGADLLRAIRSSTRVIFVGDVNQLPSVGPGNVLRDMIESGAIPIAHLTIIKRQDENAQIVRHCAAIKDGRVLPFQNRRDDDFFWVDNGKDADTTAEWCAAQIVEMVRSRLPRYYGAHPMRDIQVIAPRKKDGDVSCKALNELLQPALNPNPPIENHTFRVGDKVIQTRNDYERDIINGDIGYMLSIDTDTKAYVVEFEAPTRIVAVPFMGHDLELAYALTVHKFQGSEARIVVIPVHKTQGHRIMQRNLLYTAISRAKEVCICVGQRTEVPKIVKRQNQQRRFTSLCNIIKAEGPTTHVVGGYPSTFGLLGGGVPLTPTASAGAFVPGGYGAAPAALSAGVRDPVIGVPQSAPAPIDIAFRRHVPGYDPPAAAASAPPAPVAAGPVNTCLFPGAYIADDRPVRPAGHFERNPDVANEEFTGAYRWVRDEPENPWSRDEPENPDGLPY